MKIECDVYRSSRKELLYLYVTAEQGLQPVPEDLLKQFGEPEKTISFELTESRKLGQEDAKTVMRNLLEKGYHLQLPPAEERFRG